MTKHITGLKLKEKYNITGAHLIIYKNKLKWEYMTIDGKRQIVYLLDERMERVIKSIMDSRAKKKKNQASLEAENIMYNPKNSLSKYFMSNKQKKTKQE